jgi:peptidoglycan hydrolase CwlO-like protein
VLATIEQLFYNEGMKKNLWIVVIIIAMGVIYVNRDLLVTRAHAVLYHSRCDEPITYHIGTIDSRFNITRTEFLSDTQNAAAIWNDVERKNLFTYDPQGKITINLIYDERQSLDSQINQLDNQLQQKDKTLKPEISSYQQQSAAFEKQLATLNQEIESWNEKGGAPPEEYARLKDEQAKMQQQATDLQAQADNLNQSADSFNGKVKELNQTVNNFQNVLTVKPEEGIYISDRDGKRIQVYFNTSRPELVHTLAHEFGHAIGLDHIPNKQAIMYAQTNDVTGPSLDDIAALKQVCKEESILTSTKEHMLLVVNQISTLVTQVINNHTN